MGILSKHNPWGLTPTTALRRQQQAQSTYMMLGQADWVLRRSEQISFSASGSTRRSMTFDVTLPEDEQLWLKWRRPASHENQVSNADEYEEHYQYVGLPITFLGKGDLIHFDATDGQGNTLHTVLSEDNGIVLYNALNYCLCAQDPEEANDLLYTLNRAMHTQMRRELARIDDIEKTLGRRRRDELRDDLAEYRTQLEDAAACLQWWCDCRDGNVLEDKTDIRYDGKPLIAKYYSRHSVKYLALNLVHDAIIQGMQGAWPGVRSSRNPGSIFPTAHVHGLPESVFARINAGSGKTPSICTVPLSDAAANELEVLRKQTIAALLEEMCPDTGDSSNSADAAMGIVAATDAKPLHDDWIMTAFAEFVHRWRAQIETSSLPASKKQEREDTLRTYLLLLSSACDTYPLVVLIPREQAHKRLLIKISFDAAYRERFIDVINPCAQTIEFAFQTYGAHSTHLEVEPLDDMILTNAQQVAAETGTQHNQHRQHNARLRARATARRLHLATKADARQPMTRLRLSLMMRRNFIVSFLLWSTMTLLFTGFAAYLVNLADPAVPFDHLPAQISGLLGQDNMLALLALILSLWMARRISTIQHPLVEGINASTNAFMNMNIALILVSAFIVCYQSTPTDAVSRICTIVIFLMALGIWLCSVWMMWTYTHRRIKDDRVLPLTIAVPHGKSRLSRNAGNPQSAVMPADKAAFSILESFSDEQRRIAIGALESTMEKIKRDIHSEAR
ncbi:hypothetical protein B1400_0375 [Bifidobacterium italicum]|uniref:Uncharacterized protein n=2 Tax=Bifidobacterium italicum TaxID=1960968 RepID=A0A2A2ELM6_9BIFI|nr:hypothetical protein B1400_0375 [Bifidobacterium italicum]